MFYNGSNDKKKIEDVKEFLDLEKGCCVPESYRKTSFYNPNNKPGERNEVIKKLRVKSCHCVY